MTGNGPRETKQDKVDEETRSMLWEEAVANGEYDDEIVEQNHKTKGPKCIGKHCREHTP